MSGEKAYQQIVDHHRPRKAGRLVPFGSSEFAEREDEQTAVLFLPLHSCVCVCVRVYLCVCVRARVRARSRKAYALVPASVCAVTF